jgi:hypothetical protein
MKVSIEEAAKLLQLSPQTVRVGLQQEKFSFGIAIKTSNQYTYHISRAQLNNYLGIKEGQNCL